MALLSGSGWKDGHTEDGGPGKTGSVFIVHDDGTVQVSNWLVSRCGPIKVTGVSFKLESIDVFNNLSKWSTGIYHAFFDNISKGIGHQTSFHASCCEKLSDFV